MLVKCFVQVNQKHCTISMARNAPLGTKPCRKKKKKKIEASKIIYEVAATAFWFWPSRGAGGDVFLLEQGALVGANDVIEFSRGKRTWLPC